MSPSPIQRLKPYFKPRPRQSAAAQSPAPAPAPPAQPAAPPPAAATPASPSADGLAARREQLSTRYRQLESDLGGLVYEMAIRDHFRLDVVVRRAAELQAVDAELTAVEQSLGLAPAIPPAAACRNCGARAPAGSAFCGRCGAGLAGPAQIPSVAAPPPSPAAAAPPAPPAAPPAAAPAPPVAAPAPPVAAPAPPAVAPAPPASAPPPSPSASPTSEGSG